MILFDFVNDEAPLFSKSIDWLCKNHGFKKSNVAIISMGRRWSDFWQDYKNFSMTDYFHKLDNKNINITNEMERLRENYNTQNCFGVDRLLHNKPIDYQNKIVVYTFLFYEYIFSTLKVSHYFTTGIAYMYNLVSYEVAKKYNVKHVSFYDIRHPHETRTAISYGVKNVFDEVENCYENYNSSLVTDSMLKQIENFTKKPAQPSYINNIVNKQTINTELIKEFFIRFKKYYFDKNTHYDYFTRDPFSLSAFKIKKLILSKLIISMKEKIFDEANISQDVYFLYPIHMQPEASTLVLAKYYVDQLATIVNISKTLPLGVHLYVKEHKSALGERFLNFYNQLKKYPNIKLISHDENTFNLIKHSKGVITLSSTVGWEALFYKKPVLVLGDVFYNGTGLTKKILSFDDLSKEVNLVIKKENHYLETDHELRLAYFYNCLLRKSYAFEFNVYKMDIKKRLLSDKNVSSFANTINETINK